MLVTGNKRFTSQVTGRPQGQAWHVQELSIRIYSDGFSFSTLQSEKEVTVGPGESLCATLDRAFQKNALLRPDYDEVNIYADYPSTRIPLDEFRSEEAQALYRLTFGDDSLQGMNIHYEMLPALEVIEVFAVDKELEQLILSHYPHATIHSFFGQLLNRMLAHDKRSTDPGRRLYVHNNGRQLFIFSYAEGRLQFANSFEAHLDSDRLYFLLYVWKQLGLSQTEDTCLLVGKDKALEKGVKRYLKHVVTV